MSLPCRHLPINIHVRTRIKSSMKLQINRRSQGFPQSKRYLIGNLDLPWFCQNDWSQEYIWLVRPSSDESFPVYLISYCHLSSLHHKRGGVGCVEWGRCNVRMTFTNTGIFIIKHKAILYYIPIIKVVFKNINVFSVTPLPSPTPQKVATYLTAVLQTLRFLKWFVSGVIYGECNSFVIRTSSWNDETLYLITWYCWQWRFIYTVSFRVRSF